jgi:choline dehydrogenase-like flavoprotein
MTPSWEADYVILGAGSAGCVLAYRLSADPNVSVLLLERGRQSGGPFIDMPKGFGKTMSDPRVMSYYRTEMEDGSEGPVWVRGRILGGSSAVNGMIYLRGQPEDYDGWASDGATGWSWQEMKRCFKELEDHELGEDELRGSEGPLGVSVQASDHPIVMAMLKAGAEMGLPIKEDLNREEQEGIGFTPRTIKNGRRVSAASAFIRPAMQRRNLRVICGVDINRLSFEGRRAIGVECSQAGVPRLAKARRDIIVSLGAIESPKLLQLSGIGPAAHLQSVGVPVVHDLPGVGANLREHKLVNIQYRLNRRLSFNHELRGLRLYKNALKYFVLKRGLMANTFDLNALVRSSAKVPRPDVQITLSGFSRVMDATTLALEPFPGIQAFAYPMRPESQGFLQIRSPNPADAPLIRPNFLATPYDRQVSIAMFRYLRQFFTRPALASLIVEESYPGARVESDAEILDLCRGNESCAHAVGTCRIGTDEMAVVDSRLRVKGVSGLRIMDCSVMPTQVSGNTNGPVMGMAWRGAELIIGDRNDV